MEIDRSALINYAHGLLKPGLENKVKAALESDPFLQIEYNGIVKMMKDFPDQDVEEVIEKIARDESERQGSNAVPEIKTKPTISGRLTVLQILKYTGVAAACIMAGYFFLLRGDENTNYAKNAVMNIGITRGATDGLQDLFFEKRFSDYISKAQELLKNDSLSVGEKETMYFNIFSCYVLLKKKKESEELIAHLPATIKNGCLIQYANAIILLQNGQKTASKQALQKIIDNCDYAEETAAGNLLKQVNQ